MIQPSGSLVSHGVSYRAPRGVPTCASARGLIKPLINTVPDAPTPLELLGQSRRGLLHRGRGRLGSAHPSAWIEGLGPLLDSILASNK